MTPDAWIVEEYDSKGRLVWKMMSFFEPTELSWFKDLKNKKAHDFLVSQVCEIMSSLQA